LTDPSVALPLLVAAARAAGETAMGWFRSGAHTSAEVSYKAGNSPVSVADIAANDVLERALRSRFPDCGWISEETADDAAWLASGQVLIVDPIDGTRAFISGDPQWSVSVGLVSGGRAVAGVVHAPALGLTYAAAARHGATLNGRAIRCASRPGLAGATVAGPRPLIDRLEASGPLGLARAPRTPSLALRLTGVAEGKHDIGLASDGAHVWDIAAADIILREADGTLIDEAGEAIRYDSPDLRRGHLAAGPATLAREAMRLIGLRG
jgi:myo-inositol-1(or 4)-monophosphatase